MSADVLAGRIAATVTGTGWVPRPAGLQHDEALDGLAGLVTDSVALRG